MPSSTPARMIAYPINMPGRYTMAVMVNAWMPMPTDSPRERLGFRIA